MTSRHFQALVAAALAALLWSGEANAQRRTCTQAYEACLKESRSNTKCTDAQARCLKTGYWIGPITGRNAGPHIKK
jgi:hypothetical protein